MGVDGCRWVQTGVDVAGCAGDVGWVWVGVERMDGDGCVWLRGPAEDACRSEPDDEDILPPPSSSR